MARSAAKGGGILLSAVVVLVVLCGFPSVAGLVYTAAVNPQLNEFIHYLLPALLGWPTAWVLWRAARQATTPRAAWLLVGAAALLLIAVTYEPVRVCVQLLHEEWMETQPGGRGYQPNP
ncbi:hypothetical protein ACQP2E_27615 [Actinoplanes sp. CA-015351]|uniref:hypothetical protein n=1 Tax=Actinoplanes sp. CA-015351 TaxID=3239897 RepID=UPI003D978657